MTTRNTFPRVPRWPSILWVAALLLATVVANGGATIQASRCPDQKSPAGAWTAMAAAQTVGHDTVRADTDRASQVSVTGLDLEVRIWNVRIGFPWLKSLPVTPGRRIVVSLWEQESDR